MVCRSAWRTLIVYNLYVVLSFLILYQHTFLGFFVPRCVPEAFYRVHTLNGVWGYSSLYRARGENGLGHFKGP